MGLTLRSRQSRPASSKRPDNLDHSVSLPERRPRRKAINLPCRLIVSERVVSEVILEDVSHRGFKMKCPILVMIGTDIELDIPGAGRVRGRVRWALGGRIGGIFNPPLADGLFDEVPVPAPFPAA